MMASQILKLVDFTKIQKFRWLKYKALFFLQIKFINYRPRATLWHKPCRCHLSNIMPDIMPDSILYDSMEWGKTCRFFLECVNHCIPQDKRDGFSCLIIITPMGLGKP